MRVFIYLWILLGTLLAGNGQAVWQNNYGIVPLHSTRADVEHLYGDTVSDACRCNFRTSNEAIHVSFASAPCAAPIYGWNVPKDTVLEFTIIPKVPLRFSQMALDLNGFVKRYSPEDIVTTYYTNVEKGIVFSVQDGNVFHIDYFPPSKENGKRCPGFPPYDGVPPPNPLGTIFDRNKINVHARLDNLAIELSTNKRIRGYIVTYAGKISRRGEAKQMAEEAKRYLIETRMISPDRIVTIDGGYREAAQYDLFALSLEMPPPTPTPTVPSNEVQTIRATTRNKRRPSKTHYKYDLLRLTTPLGTTTTTTRSTSLRMRVARVPLMITAATIEDLSTGLLTPRHRESPPRPASRLLTTLLATEPR